MSASPGEEQLTRGNTVADHSDGEARPLPRRGWQLLFTIAGVGSFLGLVYFVVWSASMWQIDIDVYLMGGAHAFSSHLYSVRSAHLGLYFTYTPFAALSFATIAWLPTTLAQELWAMVNIAALVSLIALCLQTLRPAWDRNLVWRITLLASLPAAYFDPLRVGISLGQINIIVTLLVLADLTGERHLLGRRIPQGVMTGIAAAIKLTPLLFVPYLLLIGNKRAAARAAITFAGCVALGELLSPSSSSAYWTRWVFDSARAGPLYYLSDQNIGGVLARFHHGDAPTSLVMGLGALVGVVGLALATLAHRRSSAFLGILVCATTALLISPITWVHHLVWVIPIIAWLALAEDRPAGGVFWAAGTAILMWAAPIWWVSVAASGELSEHGWQLVASNSFFYAMVAFLVGVAVLLVRRPTSELPPAESCVIG